MLVEDEAIRLIEILHGHWRKPRNFVAERVEERHEGL